MKSSKGLTPRQAEAVETIDENVFVAAGAGTGKTRVLVARYLELLRTRRATVYRIAAVTYTEKAAKGMKDRIREACESFENSATDDDEREFWSSQRVALENGYIGTIHALCGMILRQCPVEVGIDPKFSIFDEVQSRLLRRKTVDETLGRLLDGDDVDTIELMRLFGRDGVAELMGRLLGRRPQAVRAAQKIADNRAEITAKILSIIEEKIRHSVEQICGNVNFEKIFATLRSKKASDASDKLEQARVRLLGLKEELSAARTDAEKLALLRQMKVARAGRIGAKGNWDPQDREALRAALLELGELLESALPEPIEDDLEDRLAEEMELSGRVVAVYRAVEKSYDRAKAEQGFLDFDDLLMKTRQFLMSESEGRQRLQRKFDYLLVDELQDTSFLERDILCLLCASRAECDDPEKVVPKSGKLFVVGDDKQSIYGFRGSEVTVFGDFRERIRKSGRVVELDRNFRSVSEGVEFANELFSRLMPGGPDREPFESVYNPLEASRASVGAFAELLVAKLPAGEHMAKRRAAEAMLVADRIERMVIDAEFEVKRSDGSASPVDYGDVVILFRALTSARTYEEALRDAGIPYYMVAGSGFYAAQEVRDVLNCLKALEYRSDGIALFGTLRSPMFGLSDEVLYLMSRTGSIRQALDDPDSIEGVTKRERGQIARAGKTLAELWRTRNSMGIAELVREVMNRTGYDAVVLGQFMGRQKLANLEKLTDQARALEGSSAFTLADFIEYADEFVRSEARESQRSVEAEEQNVVRLMTVHRAKGLEFPVVFLADMSRRLGGHATDVMIDRALGLAVRKPGAHKRDHGPLYRLLSEQARRRGVAEELRLLYVALTRAQDRLVLCGSRAGSGGKQADRLGVVLRALGAEADELTDGDKITFGSGCTTVRTEATGAISSVESEAAQAGWLGVQRLKKLAAGRSGEGVSEELVRQVGPVQPSFARKRQFSVTELLTYRNCPRRYYYERVACLPQERSIGAKRDKSSIGGLLGTVVHRALALWDLRDEAVLNELAERAASEVQSAGLRERKTLAHEAEGIIKRAVKAKLFEPLLGSGTSQVERSFCFRVGTSVVEGIIDRLTEFDDGGCEVIDYKTDRMSADEVETRAEQYRFQVGVYALAASEAIGRVSRGSVLFLSPGKWVRWDISKSVMAEVADELTRCISGIQTGRFDPCTGECDRCGYSFVCPDGKHSKSGR